ncbi:hypothetical protein QOM21_13025 [Streptomyces sp. Pv4-95]|uniref:hypothetical protein n=1 Tax=Streptomyces sp. Pv4-95 TaxID=3049543 RepID=UPI0038929B20
MDMTVVTGVLDVVCAVGVIGVALATGMTDVAHGHRRAAGRAALPVCTGVRPALAGRMRPAARPPRRRAALSCSAQAVRAQATGTGRGDTA